MRMTYLVHIVAGCLVVLSGYIALYATKGATLHRRSGMLFFDLMWLPMAVFELVLGPWLLVKGVNTDRGATSEPRPTIRATR